jgi:ABC-type dipeptide/oligopeptide/nickel transport system permease component
MAFVMVGAAAVVTLNLLADLLVRALDPRRRVAT